MLTSKKSIAGVRFVLMLALLLLLLSSWPADAKESPSIGRIIAIRGQATAIDNSGSPRTLQLKSEIGIDELIRTGQSCRLQIMFADNTIVSLGPASEFQVKDYAWDAASGQGKMTSRVNEGVFRVLGGSITKSSPQNFLTETPSATIGIRGSMYAGRLRGGELQVVFQGGKGIYVKNALGSVDITTPGFGTKLAGPEQAPLKPYKVPVADLEKLDPLAISPGESGTSTDQAATSPPSEGKISGDNTNEDITGDTPGDTAPEPTTATAPAAEGDSTGAQTLPDNPLVVIDSPQKTSTNDQLKEQTEPPTSSSPPPPPPPSPTPVATVSGRFMAVQQDDQIAVNVADLVWSGSLSGDISNDSAAVPPAGILSVQANTNNGVVPIDDLPVAFYDPSQTFSGESKLQNQLRNVTLLGSPVVFNTAAVGSDNAGEFAVFALDDTFNSTYAYRELGFAGTPTSSLPTTGINIFHGPLLVSLKNITSDEFESYSYSSQMFVNWHSNKVFGVIVTPGPSPGDPLEANGFFFGDVTATQSGNQFSNVHFVGMDVVGFDSTTTGPGPGPGPAVDMPLTIEGSTSFAQFYGSQTQGIGLVANGTTIDVQTQVAQENWLITAAGYRDTTTLASTTGTVNWQGFAVGIGEDMNQIDVNRRLYMNLNPADFSLTIDRDNGTFTGSLTLTDQDDPSAMISNLQIGGSNGSAYISDHLLIAEIGGGTPIFVSPSSGPLKTYGNYLITEDPSGQQLASYASWGTWEIAYSEPVTGKDYHVHNPGSLWVAGQPTPAADLAALAASSFIGVYNGKAEGVAIPSSGSFARLPTGTFSMTVDFGTSMLTSGSINFPAGDINPAVNFGIDPISIPGNGFSASISSPNFGTVNGAFFGPNAASVAGNFDAQDGTLRYIGVFGGDR